MERLLNDKIRYLQIAFNYDMSLVRQILPTHATRAKGFIIEAGTPYIKREGLNGIRFIRRLWDGQVIADLKTVDGAVDEIDMAHHAAGRWGSRSWEILPTETLDLFIDRCVRLGMISMIDMLGVD